MVPTNRVGGGVLGCLSSGPQAARTSPGPRGLGEHGQLTLSKAQTIIYFTPEAQAGQENSLDSNRARQEPVRHPALLQPAPTVVRQPGGQARSNW